jgi:diguanylate cyclase
MLHAIGCIAEQHDLRLVAIACVVCAIGALTTLQMLARARATIGHVRWGWIAAGGADFSCFVWTTHFVAMLAYAPGLPMAFNLPLTIVSLLIAVAGGWAGLACALAPSRAASAAAGLVFGGSIGAMHFAGMEAFQVPGLLTFGTGDVAAAWTTALVLAPAAMLRLRAGNLASAILLLVLAVAGLHFIAMAAVTIHPGGAPVLGVDADAISISVAAIGLLVLTASLGTALVDKHLAARLHLETERFRRFADATFEGLFFLDHGLVSDANGVLCRMLGRTPAQIAHAPLASFFAPESHATLQMLQASQAGSSELALLDAAGNRHAVDVLARPLSGVDSAVAVVAVRDATERKHAERRIQELAHTDPLTGLANRLLLRDRLAGALAEAASAATAVAVLCLDLDRFKSINDIMGHHAGDLLLIEVAARLRALTRAGDTIARLGGDEFVVVQPFDGDNQRVHALAQRLVRLLAEPYVIEGKEAEISASIGVAIYPTDAADGETLLRHADLALYRAKQEGRSVYRFFEPAMDTRLRARRAMEHDLRHALAHDELFLQYQPVFASDPLAIVGYEALLRWHHPHRGNVPPSEFIPIAEDCSVILPIGAWVLETACAEAAAWRDPLTIAVNLSPAQFRNQDLPEQIAQILARTGLAPHRLELEVTEGVLMDDTARAAAALAALKAQGIRIALDDFGTGYSSLSYLRRFPFARLKIDRAFIAELGTDADADAIVHCIMAMARSLRLAVTAEGVETELQLTLLRKMPCSHLQGYLLGRPASAGDLQHRVAA